MTGSPDSHVAHALATAMLGGEWEREAIRGRVALAIGRTRRLKWLTALVDQTLDYHPRPPRDAPRELATLLPVLPAWPTTQVRTGKIHARHWHPTPTEMGRPRWPVTPIDDLQALADLLTVTMAELAWFADVRGWERSTEAALRHYRVLVRRKTGGVRVLEVPKPRLREIQRRLLRHAVAPIAVHPMAHGAVPGRSVATALAPHAGQPTVLRCDLEAFYPSIAPGRIWGVLRQAGFPEAVAHTITGLTTTSLSRSAWAAVPAPPIQGDSTRRERHYRLGRHLAAAHLPQGAPTSPALANLVAFGLDRRLAGLARTLDLNYTRYVDDLIFSGAGLHSVTTVRAVTEIVADEGFRLAPHKTIVLGASQRQQLLGAVVNTHVGAARTEIDRLRAIVHNCTEQGWPSQTRGRTGEEFRAHLTGRIAWVNGLDPRRGAQLMAGAADIDWIGTEHPLDRPE